MKLIKTLLLLTFFLSSAVFAKPHTGTFKFMHFTNEKNSFNTTIEVIYSIDIFMGEPVVKARAKYSIMGLVNVDGKQVDLPENILDKLKIYNLKISVPFESKTVHKMLYIVIDLGAMGKRGEWSYNTPGSPNWNKWIRSSGYGYTFFSSDFNKFISKEEAIKAYKGFERLGVSDGLGSLAEAVSIKYNVTAARQQKKEKPKETAKKLDALFDDVLVTQNENAKKEQARKETVEKKKKQKIAKSVTKNVKQIQKEKHSKPVTNKITKKVIKNTKKKKKKVTNHNIAITGNLMWQNEAYTIKEVDATVGSSYGKTQNWKNSVRYCRNLSLAGYKDWRLPNYKELLLLRKNRMKLKNFPKFIGTPTYWASNKEAACGRLMDDFIGTCTGLDYVRCVRQR